MKGLLVISIISLCACSSVDPKSPEGAFAQIATCIDTADTSCLYNKLDRESRWSLSTIHRKLGEIRDLVDKTYPEDARESAYGVWAAEAEAKDAEALFQVYCEKRKCLGQVAKRFGAPSRAEKKGENTVIIETIRDGRYEMSYAEERWGITLFRDELQALKIRIYDRLAQVERNAREFEEQRSAGALLDSKNDENEHKEI